jgi:anti-anti-sigma factor
MTVTMYRTTDTMLVEPNELSELVRGREQDLLERVTPLVRRHSVSLDLESVERIDAAGISALISLYSAARETGHRFTVSNASSRVEKILALVGLDHILLSQDAAQASHCGALLDRPAA